MDALATLMTLAFASIMPIGALIVMIAGISRLRGRRSRFDRAASIAGPAVAVRVFPPSLRGGGLDIPPPAEEQPAGDPPDGHGRGSVTGATPLGLAGAEPTPGERP